MSEFLNITFGVLAEPIKTQLGRQGIKAKQADVRAWQRDADAISRLSIRRYLSRTQVDKTRRILMTKMAQGCSK